MTQKLIKPQLAPASQADEVTNPMTEWSMHMQQWALNLTHRVQQDATPVEESYKDQYTLVTMYADYIVSNGSFLYSSKQWLADSLTYSLLLP